MAPRKAKSQGKRNNIKIKSKIATQKRGLKPMKKNASGEKPLAGLKWAAGVAAGGVAKACDPSPKWFQPADPCESASNSSEYDEYPAKDPEEKSTSSYSEECNCDRPKYSDKGILKNKFSRESLVAKYIKSGMDHVASFIVESAIRFGEQHGVVVPDKNAPNVYEIAPNNRISSKYRKIRFKIPEKTLGYEDAKKAMWRSQHNNDSDDPYGWTESSPNGEYGSGGIAPRNPSWGSTTDSLEEIIPMLQKLEEGGGGIVGSELDLHNLQGDQDRERKRERERERRKDRLRSKGKRYKSAGAASNKGSPERSHAWKRCKRDSLELGRKRLRPATCPRKPQSASPNSY